MIQDYFQLRSGGNESLIIFKNDKKILDREFDKLTTINAICEIPPISNVATIRARDLTLDCRLLHHVIGYYLLLKSGNREK